jgi:organic radical activating enzyme
MNQNELKHALDMKDRLNKVGSGFCLAKWDQVTMHLHNGMTHSCHHPAPHKIPLSEIENNHKAIHNSKQKIEQRKSMLCGERPGGCNYCWKVEDANPDAVSDRYLKSANLFEHRFDKIVDSGLGEDHIPEYVEVSFSNACNLKCTYCGPHFSSKWVAEQEANDPLMLIDTDSKEQSWNYHGLDYLKSINELPIPAKDYNPYVEAFWKWWPELKTTLKTLRVTGGEPLMSKDTFKLLKLIEEEPMPELELGINTNLNAPEKNWQQLIEFIKKNEDKNLVKKITLYTSLDGWGEQAEYIRSGLDFNMLWDRLLYMIEEHPTVDNTIMTAYSLLSLPSYKRMLEEVLKVKQKYNRYNGLLESRYNQYKGWFSENSNPKFWTRNEKACVVHLDISPIYFPPFLSVTTPYKELTMPYLFDQYAFMMHNLTLGEDNRNFYDFEAEKMGRVADFAFYSGMGYDKQIEDNRMHQQNFKSFVDEIDKRRGTDFCTVFPELEEFYRDNQ